MHTDKIIHTNRIYSREEIEAREYKLHVGRVLQDCKEIVKDVCDRNFDPIRQHIKEARFNRLVSGNISKNPMFTGVTREALQVMQNGDLTRTGFTAGSTVRRGAVKNFYHSN